MTDMWLKRKLCIFEKNGQQIIEANFDEKILKQYRLAGGGTEQQPRGRPS